VVVEGGTAEGDERQVDLLLVIYDLLLKDRITAAGAGEITNKMVRNIREFL
jgi:hypothetical protein